MSCVPRQHTNLLLTMDTDCYTVTAVSSSRDAIHALHTEGSVDIILAEVLDLPMEESMKLLNHIMPRNELRHIPVISELLSLGFFLLFFPGTSQTDPQYSVPLFFFCLVFSTHDEVSVVLKFLELGAKDYILKPLRVNEVALLWTHTWRRRHKVCPMLDI
uniref:Putative two-component response regulator-like APRR1 isoform X1 n=1 Tax=Davidia involucrata TaxID=16924 RepID=A0A5B7BNM9_DAVIN